MIFSVNQPLPARSDRPSSSNSNGFGSEMTLVVVKMDDRLLREKVPPRLSSWLQVNHVAVSRLPARAKKSNTGAFTDFEWPVGFG
jgi:hypothetical protein